MEKRIKDRLAHWLEIAKSQKK